MKFSDNIIQYCYLTSGGYMKFSELDPKTMELDPSKIIKLKTPRENLEKIILEFQKDLNLKNQNNLEFIKFVIKLLKENKINMPALPETANKLMKLSSNPQATFDDYSQIIKNDPLLTMKVIKLANSPLYRGLRDVSDISLALSRIGIEGIKQIILTDSLNSVVFKNQTYKKHIDKIWKDSLITALLASKTATLFNLNPSLIYTIALVHKIGSILIFDIVEEYNKKADFEHFLDDEFALRIGRAFNKRLTVKILENWFFTKEQIISVKNYDIKPIPVSPLEHKILYLSQITVGALEVIMMDYDEETLFPYEFMLKEAMLEIDPLILKNMTMESYKDYKEIIHNLS